MPSMKLFFFGSLFTFQPIAVEELRKEFQQAFSRNQLTGHAPLISYDQKNSSFSFQCEQSDAKPAQLFRALLKDYINEHQAEVDLLENQRIIPVHGTVIDDPIISNAQLSLDSDEGLVPFSDEEDSGGEERLPESVGFQTLVWKPGKGSVGLLTFDVVKALSDQTACKFSVNPHRNEVRLYGGDMSHALSRLSALEAIMFYLHNPANAHVLMLNTATDNTRIDFTIPSDSALRRILVDPDVKSIGIWLGNKRIEQLATYMKGAKAEQAFATPSNLTTTSQCSASIEVSNIWSDFTFAQVGDAGNQARLGEVFGCGKVEKLDPLPVSHYMSEKESHIIEQWAGHVVETADPNEIVPEAPLDNEGQKTVGRTRRVKKVDEDEDEEDDDQDLPFPCPSSAPKSMNDALNLQFSAQKAKTGRVRVKKIDEDEDEDFRGSVSSKDAEQQNTWTYPSSAGPNTFGFRSMPPRKRTGRQRMVKADSDDEYEDNDSTALVPDQKLSPDWNRTSPLTHSPVHRDKDRMSSDGNDGVYPQNSCSSTLDVPSEQNRKPTNPVGWTASQNDPPADRRHDLKPALPTEKWSNFAAASSTNSRGTETHAKGRGRGRGRSDRRQGPKPPHSASTSQAAPSNGHARCRVISSPNASNQHPQGLSNGLGTRVSQVSALSDRGRARGDHSRRDNNRFGLLAADTLIDIHESDVVDSRTLSSPPGFEKKQHLGNQSTEAISFQKGTNIEIPNANLIDVSTPEMVSNYLVAPPPGFESLGGADIQGQSSNQRPRFCGIPHHGASPARMAPCVPSMRDDGPHYINTSSPGVDLVEMARRRIDQLHKARGGDTSSDASVEHLQEDDEPSTRTYHRTMNQQARNPTPKKKVVEQKRNEALQNAWGISTQSSQTKVHGLTAASTSRKVEGSEISAAKKSLLRGKDSMAKSHPKAANQEQRALQNDQFVAALTPVFKAAKAFPGVLKFEVQFGQFLSPNPEEAYQSNCMTVNQWHKLYDSARGRLSRAATFTNIITRNGADVDHILGMKMPGGGNAMLFHHDRPGRVCIRFEFHCQGKNNDEFKLVLNSKGECEIERPFRKIGQINFHVPGQIWDAAGMFTGSTRFPEEDALKDAAEQLANSVYIPEGRNEIEMSYRLPSSNEFAVKRVVMRRVSRHMCALMDKEDMQLQITEVQRLFIERRSDGIYLAYASKYEKMVHQMMIHFEVSLISESIERALSANTDLAVGDVTAAWTEDSLLQKWRTNNLLEMTHMVVSKIDGVGFHNVGSAVFFLNQDSVLAGGSAVAIGSQMPNQSLTKAVGQNAQVAINVPGVRGGVAQPTTQGYVLGYGGARIPVPRYDEPVAVIPDDSASQAPERGQAQMQDMPGFW